MTKATGSWTPGGTALVGRSCHCAVHTGREYCSPTCLPMHGRYGELRGTG